MESCSPSTTESPKAERERTSGQRLALRGHPRRRGAVQHAVEVAITPTKGYGEEQQTSPSPRSARGEARPQSANSEMKIPKAAARQSQSRPRQAARHRHRLQQSDTSPIRVV